MRVPFQKLHGLGNDFVLLDARTEAPARLRISPSQISKKLVRAFADRKRGVGFDQLMVLRSSKRVHAILDIYNTDGSMAEMCGNGLRAAALYLWTMGGARAEGREKANHERLVFETLAGDRSARALGPLGSDDERGRIECDLGVPKIQPAPPSLVKGIKVGGRTARATRVSVGNPHLVVSGWPRSFDEFCRIGAKLETHRAFPKRTNVEFVRVQDPHSIEVMVWERGVGFTEACGTGAVAAAAALIHAGCVQSPVEVRFPGGIAEVSWDSAVSSARLRGHAEHSFEGMFNFRD